MFIIDEHDCSLVMRLPVVGIIIVFCLQLGFIVFSAINRQAENVAGVHEVDGLNSTPNIPNLWNDNDWLNADDVSNPQVAIHRRPSRETSLSNSRPSAVAEPVILRPQRVAAFQRPREANLRTEYPRTAPFVPESKNYQLSASTVSLHKKKSFFSKSVSIFKKPYDWTKALVSKIR